MSIYLHSCFHLEVAGVANIEGSLPLVIVQNPQLDVDICMKNKMNKADEYSYNYDYFELHVHI